MQKVIDNLKSMIIFSIFVSTFSLSPPFYVAILNWMFFPQHNRDLDSKPPRRNQPTCHTIKKTTLLQHQ